VLPLIGIAILVILSISLISYSVLAARIRQQDVLKRRLDERKPTVGRQRAQESSAGAWFRKKAAPLLAKPVNPKSVSDQSNLRIRLANAGLRSGSAPVLFLASKSILAVTVTVLTLLSMLTSGAGGETQKVFGYTIFAAGVGFFLPEVWLSLAKRSRAERITRGLADCLDLMVVSVEAGLGLDAAIQRVGREMGGVHKDLSEELVLCNMEVQMGITRSEALKNLGVRTDVPEIKSLVAILIQAERLGTSVAAALRVHADSLRVKRRQEAEERAAKTAVKLIIPLILFIFPAIFVVLAGPAMLKLFQTLSNISMQGG